MEITTVTSSYSRKINNKLYGGADYESTDVFCSLTADVETGEDALKAEKELRSIARQAVENAVGDEIVSFQGGAIAPKEYFEFLYDYVAGRIKDVNYFNEVLEKLPPAHRKVIDTIRKARATAKRDSIKSKKE